ncbi:MAG TPA: DUF2865 domain-containing protein [Beijerinckiaceae bacterium]|nr:DUF2865 domain-containing protein [Beijerinckiaceae bacterium]
MMPSRTRKAQTAALRGAITASALLAASGLAAAQGLDCSRLQSAISAVRGDPGRAQRFEAAARRQSVQINRTVAYAHSIGCDNRQFLFFGSAPPPQCPQITGRIRRMQNNLRHLQEQADRAGGIEEKRRLQERYNAYCGGGDQASLRQPRNFFQQLFGGGPSPPPAVIPVNPDRGLGAGQSGETAARGGSKAVCVLATNGSFFPISYTATRAKLSALQDQCQALCPNVKTELFTYPQDGVIDQGVSIDGKPYSSLPNADLFEKEYDPASTCVPPNETWAQAMAGAERLVGERRTDILVTRENSNQMSEAQSNSAARQDRAGSRKQSNNAAGAPPGGSADIFGQAVKGKFYGENSGVVKEEVGLHGVKQRVRIVGPTF